MATQVLSRLLSRFNVPLGLEAAFSAPTIAELARLVDQRPMSGGEGDSVLVTARRPTGSATEIPPLFLIHAVGGDVLNYAALADALGRERTVHVLQSAGIRDEALLPSSILDMAETYVRIVQRQQPDGPYCLAGWSFGGIVAFEMARRLSLREYPVAFVGLLDSRIPLQGEITRERGPMLLWEAWRHELDIGRDEIAALSSEEQLVQLVRRAEQAALIPEGIDLDYVRAVLRVWSHHLRLLEAYEPGWYDGVTHLFRAIDDPDRPDDPLYGWGDVLSDLRVADVGGTHYSMLRAPFVESFAKTLGERVRAAVVASPGGLPRCVMGPALLE